MKEQVGILETTNSSKLHDHCDYISQSNAISRDVAATEAIGTSYFDLQFRKKREGRIMNFALNCMKSRKSRKRISNSEIPWYQGTDHSYVFVIQFASL